MIVSVRQITLAVSGAVVLLMSLYLYVKVRAAPAQPSPTALQGAALQHDVATQPPPPTRPTDPWGPGGGSPQAREEATRNQLVGSDRVEPGQPATPPPQIDQPENLDDDLKASDGMTQANKLFDRGDWDEASAQALKMLETDPKNSRMLRIVVSVACFTNDPDKAQKYWALLGDDRDKAQMSVRCSRYGINFKQ
jgi:hypothetical protein